MHSHRALFLLLAMATAWLNGCGGEADGDRVIAEVSVIAGDNQIATVGTQLPIALTTQIKNAVGKPIAGQLVSYVVTAGGGTVFAGAALSDSNGFARERWTLGKTAGSNKLEVRAVSNTGAPLIFATFTATGTASDPTSINIFSGNHQSAIQGQALERPVVATVRDAYGNPTAGITVKFKSEGSGIVVPQVAITNSAGEATAAWTLGVEIGSQTLSASIDGLPSIRFDATATKAAPGLPASIEKISGDAQTINQHALITTPMQVIVKDALGNGVPGVPVSVSAGSGSLYVNPLTTVIDIERSAVGVKPVITGADGKALWSGFLHGSGNQQVMVAVAGLKPVVFDATVVATDHVFDGLYLCDSVDYLGAVRSFYLTVLDGNVDINRYIQGRTSSPTAMNEADGTFTTFYSSGTTQRFSYTGRLVIESFQRASGSGTFFQNWFGEIQPGTWSCARQ